MTSHPPAPDAGAHQTRPQTDGAWTLERIRDLGAVTSVPIAAAIFGLSRSDAYDLIRTQRFPVPVLRIGNRYRVPVHAILTALHVPDDDPPDPTDPPADLTDPGSDASMDHTKSSAPTPQHPPHHHLRSVTPVTEEVAFKYCSCRDENRNKLGAKCPRLRRPNGAWNSNHGAWYYQIELPAKPNGDRWQLRRRNFDTRDDAKADRAQAEALLQLAGDDDIVRHEIARLLKQTKQGHPFPARDDVARRVRAGVPATTTTTVGEFLWKWHARRKIEPSTLRSYGTHIRVHLEPHLGHIPLDKLRNSHIEAMFNTIADRNIQIDIARSSDDPAVRASVKGQRTISPATMHRIRATLRKALNDAIRKDRLLEFNHAIHVELPSGKAPKARVWTAGAVREWEATGLQPSAVMVWTPEQAGAFLDYAHDHDIILYPIAVLILHRGLRRGEALGLRDTDVDLTDGTVTISQQITTLGYEPVIKKVKSEAGDRLVTLNSSTTTALRSYHARRARWQLVSGDTWPDTGLFFVQPGGNAWHPQQITDRFERLVAACGLPPIRLHDLRHCAATYLKAAGSDLKDIQETLGHATLAITADIYTAVIHELQKEREKADAAAALVPRATRRAG